MGQPSAVSRQSPATPRLPEAGCLRSRRDGGSRITIQARLRAFTLVELMVTLAVIALLLSIVVPHYVGRVTGAEEAVLKENLTLMRDALDKHYADAGRYPDALDELVTKRYLRSIPSDPITRSSETWIAVAPIDPGKGGVYDVRSGAKGAGSNGKPYEQW